MREWLLWLVALLLFVVATLLGGCCTREGALDADVRAARIYISKLRQSLNTEKTPLLAVELDKWLRVSYVDAPLPDPEPTPAVEAK